MSFLARGIARGRLKDRNPIARAVHLEQEGDRVAVAFDGRRYAGQVGAAPVVVSGTGGDPLRLTFRRRGDTLVQRFDGERGGRTNTFTVGADGRLRVEVTVRSPRLPGDVVYRLTYAR